MPVSDPDRLVQQHKEALDLRTPAQWAADGFATAAYHLGFATRKNSDPVAAFRNMMVALRSAEACLDECERHPPVVKMRRVGEEMRRVG